MAIKEKIVATIEARMTSTRLPGKVLLEASGRSMLEHLVRRLRKVELIDEIVLATTTNEADDPLIQLAKKMNITYFRGSEENVMDRVIRAARSVNTDIIVEITGDCPIIDPLIIDQTIQIFLNNNCDYASNVHIRSYPDGMDTQVFRLETLKKSFSMTKNILDYEHVTLHIRNNPSLFKQFHVIAPRDVYWPDLGLTLDEVEDYRLLKRIIEYFGEENPYFSCKEVVNLLKTKPNWVFLNQHVNRKGDS